jgi:ribonucleoside-diphosphate reductase alpha chain
MYDLGCKGGTIYRDGSRDEQILAVDSKKLGKDVQDQMEKMESKQAETKAEAAPAPTAPAPTPTPNPTPAPTPTTAPVEETPAQTPAPMQSAAAVIPTSSPAPLAQIAPRSRPDVMHGSTYKVNTAYGNLYVTVNEDANGPFEVFSQLGKAGGFFGAQTEAICRMISLSLRCGISIKDVIDQLKGIRGPDPIFHNGERILSLPDAIAHVLENHLNRGQTELKLEFKPAAPKIEKKQEQLVFEAVTQEARTQDKMMVSSRSSIANMGHAPACPDCSNMLIMAEGCMKCEVCGYSKCG